MTLHQLLPETRTRNIDDGLAVAEQLIKLRTFRTAFPCRHNSRWRLRSIAACRLGRSIVVEAMVGVRVAELAERFFHRLCVHFGGGRGKGRTSSATVRTGGEEAAMVFVGSGLGGKER